MSKYQATIGIETHVQLKTKTKLFAAVGNDASQAKPNTLISHICVGMPGALPVLNEKALELAIRAAFALNTKPQKNSYFERKHYFYPDSPTGYQISQLHAPIIIGGSVEINIDGQKKLIGITRAQLEADAGKNTHPAGANYSLVDLNRAGTPLLEIISEPEIHSPAEAKAYVRELYLLMKYADVSDCDLYLGHMRFDVNVSLSSSEKLGIRAEVKNLNSFRSVENAVTYEIKRQTEMLEKGETVVQETRGWDEDKQKTIGQRGKEEAHDYRYMPEPDIPPLELEDAYTEKIETQMPPLPDDVRKKLATINIDSKTIEDILDNTAVCTKTLEALEHNAVVENVRRIVFDSLEEPESLQVSVGDHIKIAEMLRVGAISSNAEKEILKAKAQDSSMNLEEMARNKAQVSDEGEIEKIVAEVLNENNQAAEDVKNGEMKAIGFLVGQVMAKSKGQANPTMAQEIIKKQLGM